MIGASLGPYRIHEKVGEGGMGEVYRATDTRLDRDVAIKVLPASVAADPDRLARFEREAKAVAALSHPNILSIFDVGDARTDDGTHVAYAVMELLDGESVRQRLEEGAIPVRKAIDYGVQVARGLAAAHDKGLVHRDIKPDNIFLLADGRVKILDFGLARAATESPEPRAESPTMTSAALTQPGTVLGTVGYMAPEQVRGHDADARSDLFAFGAVLYEMVAGRRAFHADTAAETMTAILREDPPELVGSGAAIPPALDRIIRHCLEKNPAERFQSARDVAFALEALSGTGTVSGATLPIDAPAERMRAGARRWVLAAGVLAVALVAAAVGYFAGGSRGGGAPIAEISYQPVTFDEGFVFAARFAADGRTIVYSADWEGEARDVFVTSVDSPDARPLGYTGADLVALSRDGDLAVIADSSIPGGNPYNRRGTLAQASLTGAALRPRVDGVHFADFAPDGEMAVVRLEAGTIKLEYPVGQVIAEGADFYTPRVSPDGAHVAVFYAESETARMHVRIYARGGALVAESRGFWDWWSLAWRDTREVWLAATEQEGRQAAVYAMDLSGADRLVFRAPGALTLHDISADGALLASFDQYRTPVEVVDGATGALSVRSWKDDGRVVGLSDDRALLLRQVGDSGGANGSVYFWRPDEPQPVRLSDGAALGLAADGTTAVVRDPAGRLILMPTGAGSPTPLNMAGVTPWAWAGLLPDGRAVISGEDPDDQPGVFAVGTGDVAPERLLPAGYLLEGGNVLSPDASRAVAYGSDSTLAVCTLSTQDCQPLTGVERGESVAGWTADGAGIFVVRMTEVPARVVRVEVATGRRTPWRTIVPLQAAVSGLRAVFAAPDGTLAYAYSRARTQLYVIRGLR